jgi:formate-dependent nitrite reductase membrane component NrfD
MDSIILWQQKWGLTFHIPWYLFLGGLAGGTMTVAALTELLAGSRERFRNFSRAAAYVTVPAIIIGGLSLTFHLGKPERGLAFPLFFTNYQSWMTIGGWILGAFAPLSIAYAAAWYFNLGRTVRVALAVLGAPMGVLMSLYTGFLLSAAFVVPGSRWYVPLWDSTYLPMLFVFSGISTGVAASGLGALLAGRFARGFAGGGADEWAVAEVASLTDAAAIVAEAAWVYIFLAYLGVGTLGQQLAFKLMTRGELAPWFWWGFVATGLAAPLLASAAHTVAERIFHARVGWVLYVKFILVLVGGLMLRYVVVWGGDLKAPLVFPPSMWPVPGTSGLPIPGLGG